MTWMKGEIIEFVGGKPKHRLLRKVRIRPQQGFDEAYFFHVSLAHQAGYPNSELGQGKEIEFEPESGSRQPRVGRFRPYLPTDGSRAAPAPSRGPFHNPYHFIPLRSPAANRLTPWKDVVSQGTLHDRFVKTRGQSSGYSGRVVCRLTTEGPVVVGGKQEDGSPDSPIRKVHPFALPDPQDASRWLPAIPGSTLRGLISSLVEAASGSALRILKDCTYTRRVEVREKTLSAVGLIVKKGSELRIRPLTLSVEEMQQPSPDQARCRVLLNAYRRQDSRHEGGRRASGQRSRHRWEPGSFLDRQRPRSWSASHQEFWYLRLDRSDWHKSRGRRLGLIGEPPIPQSEWKELPEHKQNDYVRGILLVLGLDGSKAENLPPKKKHEYFLPYPPERDKEDTLSIPNDVACEFDALLKEAASLSRGGDADDFPYLHQGRDRNGLSPRVNDLVYFDKDQRTNCVTRISYSAIWRRSIPGSLHEAVGSVSDDLLPLHPGREQLTLAESLFGIVEIREDKKAARALAGRVRFSHALVAGGPREGTWYDEPVALKILATPKPPSPALYFGNNGYLKKGELKLGSHEPQGRKVYLHHRASDIEAKRYESQTQERHHQKAEVRPLKPGTLLYFHVDFVNLSKQELGFLLYALRPTHRFRHKLGMGKPLGLGQVRIDPVALCFIDRQICYGVPTLFSGKYQACESSMQPEDWGALRAEIRHRYRHEAAAMPRIHTEEGSVPRLAELQEEARRTIPEEVRTAIELLGDPGQITREVTYPMTRGQGLEGEHFHWFVANDRGAYMPLSPVTRERGVPTLSRHERAGRSPRPPR